MNKDIIWAGNRILGFTLVELVISIGLLAIVMGAVSSIFSVATANYQTQSLRGFFQKEINFTTDQITRDVKQAVDAPANYDTFTEDPSSPTILILTLPSVDSGNNFIYTGGILQTDHIVYYLSGTDLKKKTYAINGSTRFPQNGQDINLLSNVSRLIFTLSPTGTPRQVVTGITLSKVQGGKTVSISADATADLRNKP